MLKKITIAENSLEPETWIEYETENVLDFLVEYFGQWPETARLYNKNVCEVSDITPENINDIENIKTMEGPFYIVIYPATTVEIIILIISLITLAIAIFNSPKIPLTASRNGENPSSNNSLSSRSNKERINGRIPDIFGQVRSIPDLISANYTFFDNNIEFEHSYMCIGKGFYLIEDIKEDVTLIDQIESSSIEIYAPFTSPNYGSPQQFLGTPIAMPIKTITRYDSVKGQILGPDSKATISGRGNVKFTRDSKIVASPLSGIDFRTLFSPGSTVKITNAIQRGPVDPIDHSYDVIFDFNGIYSISSVTRFELTVSNAATNPDWNSLITGSIDSNNMSPNLFSETSAWAGPFTVDRIDTTEIWCNFVAPNGIYTDDGIKKVPFPVDIELKITPINLNGSLGTPEIFISTLLWNTKVALNLGATLKAVPTFIGKCQVSVRRLTNSQINAVDEVQWRDFYAVSPMLKTEFGDVTTVQTLTRATVGALAISNRKLNMLATRKIPTRISGSTFSTVLHPIDKNDPISGKKADDIISFICLDPKIGRRQSYEIDFDNIYSTIQSIIDYFGTVKAAEFSYTFDSTSLSFEETISSIAHSIFCIAYRRGNQIKLNFEKKNDLSTILFNHRNKIPGTETRTISFGNINNNDGVEYQYIDPVDDSVATIYLPTVGGIRTATNANLIESIGVRSYTQAWLNANRIYNKIKYQTLNIECEVTAESNICTIGDRIIISDGTRQGSQEGEIVSQNILALTLSQDVDLLVGTDYTIFLQFTDGTVQSIPITKTLSKNVVLLNSAPSLPLALDFNLYAKTTFIITSNNDTRKTAFILTEKSPKGVMTSDIKAINYDVRYYQNDKDVINGII